MQNIAIFASHNGSGLSAIQNAIIEKKLNLNVALVISNNSTALVLEKAKKYNLQNYVVNSKTTQNVDKTLVTLLKEHKCSYVFLSGYMKKIGSSLTNNFTIINSHPSLLPKHGGSGMYGRFVHESVIANKETVSGVTIHKVDEEYDSGKVILQKELILEKHETVDTLESKIKELEGQTIVEALANFIA